MMNTRPHSKVQSRAQAQSGFTLVELLVGMALMGIILSAMISVFVNSAEATTNLNHRSDAQQEVLNGIQLIGARLKEAWYIYPVNANIVFPTHSLIVNPNNNSATFRVGVDPVLAMIIPPRVGGAGCVPGATPPQTEGCYSFFAYYGMARNVWTGAATGFRDPGDNAAGASSWVLSEYKAYFATKPAVVNGGASPAVPTGASDINLLMEDVAPAIGGAAPNYLMFNFTSTTVTAPGVMQEATWPLTYVSRVRQNVRVSQVSRGKTIALPSPTTTFELHIYPENIGRSGI